MVFWKKKNIRIFHTKNLKSDTFSLPTETFRLRYCRKGMCASCLRDNSPSRDENAERTSYSNSERKLRSGIPTSRPGLSFTTKLKLWLAAKIFLFFLNPPIRRLISRKALKMKVGLKYRASSSTGEDRQWWQHQQVLPSRYTATTHGDAQGKKKKKKNDYLKTKPLFHIWTKLFDVYAT